MPSSTSSSDIVPVRARPPWALLASLLAFAACEALLWSYPPWIGFCARYAPPYRVSDPLRTSVRIRQLPRHAAQPPVLLIGSSQILEGLDCAAFEARFPSRVCVNLGIAGGTPLDVLFLEGQIEARVEKRVLVTGLFPQTLHFPPKAAFSDTRTLRCLFRSRAWLSMTAHEWIETVYGQVQNLSETLRLKDALWHMWEVVGPDPLGALRREIPAQPPRTLDGRRPLPPTFFQEQIGKVNPEIAPGRFTAAHEIALEEVIAREARQGNRIVVIDFPTRWGYETTITSAAIDQHRRLVERLAGWPEVVLVGRNDLPPLEDGDFHDFTHLRPSGREKMSTRLAEILARAEGTPPNFSGS